jgi:hypothetical protein
MPIILAIWKAEIRRIKVPGQPRKTVHETPISKITRAKWTGGMAQAVEHLLCEFKAQLHQKEKTFPLSKESFPKSWFPQLTKLSRLPQSLNHLTSL